jgi:hypothetical protein
VLQDSLWIINTGTKLYVVVLYVDKAAAVDGKRGHGALLRLCRLLFPLPQALQAERPHLTAQ